MWCNPCGVNDAVKSRWRELGGAIKTVYRMRYKPRGGVAANVPSPAAGAVSEPHKLGSGGILDSGVFEKNAHLED